MAIIIFIIWSIIASYLGAKISAKVFPVSRILNIVLGLFFSLFLLGLAANIFNAWFKLTDWAIAISGLLVLVLLILGRLVLRPLPPKESSSIDDQPLINWNFFYWLIFLVLIISSFVVIFSSVSTLRLISPWQVLPDWWILLIIATSLFVFGAVFSREKTSRLLIGIILFSLLLHSYLLVYQNGFGGDRWRHLGSESRILSGLEYQPTLLTNNLWQTQIGRFKVPSALIDRAKLSYGLEWSLEVIANKISGLDISLINKILLPLLWSIFLPLIIYVAALLIFNQRQKALLAAALSSSLYLLQYYGAQGLPASYGFLTFAGGLLLWLAYLKNPDKRLLVVNLIFTALLYFNYSLSFILTVVVAVLALALRKNKKLALALGAVSAALMFVLDWDASSRLSFSLGQIYHTWCDGDLLYFCSSARLSPLIGEVHLLLDLAVLLLFIVVMIYLLIGQWKRDNRLKNLLALIFVVISASYLTSWLFTNGDHLLSRRLTLFIALPLIFILAEAFGSLAKNKKVIFPLVIFLALFTAFNYYSGPVLSVSVSDADLAKARNIWPEIKNENSYCVKDDIEVILALEYVSAKEFQETVNSANCAKNGQ